VRDFADRKGFAVATDGTKIFCTRCQEPLSSAKKREKKNASGVVPVEKRRIYNSSMRCGCPFKILFSFLDLKDKDNISVRLNGSSNFKHSNRYFPLRAQLVVQKKKAGAYATAVNETQDKCILLLLSTNNKVPSIRLFLHKWRRSSDNLERQGNAPAEANQLSILQRLGNAFCESHVMLIQALMKRHQDLTAERDYIITKYRLEHRQRHGIRVTELKKRRYFHMVCGRWSYIDPLCKILSVQI
jgi:hypothetical protein